MYVSGNPFESAVGLRNSGVKYQETQRRCPANVVAVECRPSEKCGKRCLSSSCVLVANLDFLPQETVERHRRNTRLALSEDLAVDLKVHRNKCRKTAPKVPVRHSKCCVSDSKYDVAQLGHRDDVDGTVTNAQNMVFPAYSFQETTVV